jgi:hypothetical protein
MTYDELYDGLKESYELHAAAFAVESTPEAPARQAADAGRSPPQGPAAQQPSARRKK